MERRMFLVGAGSSIFAPTAANAQPANSNTPWAADILRDMMRWDDANPHPNRELFEFAEILDRKSVV